MKYLTPLYALEAGEALQLRRRLDGAALLDIEVLAEGSSLAFQDLPASLDAEALRLLLQWAFDEQDAETVSLPLSAELLPLLAAVGGRMEGERILITAKAFASANRALGCKGAAWLERSQPNLQVAAIALINDRDEVLLAQRPIGKSFAGLWEFPGGKIKEGESPELALCREVREELGLSVWNSCLSPLTFVSHAYKDFYLTMLAFACYKFEGEPKGIEGQILKWWPHKDLRPDLMPPANAPLVHAVQDLLG